MHLGGHDLSDAILPQDLIPGSVEQIDATINALVSVGVPCQDVGDTLPKLDTQAWTGPAAQAFHAVYDPQPEVWIFLGVGLNHLSDALKTWRDAVQHGQAEAGLALQEYHEAQAMTHASMDAYQQQVQAHNDAVVGAAMGITPAPAPLLPMDDLGASLRQQAIQRLADARQAVADAEGQAILAVGAARDALPEQPSAVQRFGDDVADNLTTLGTQLSDAGQGAADAVAGMVDTLQAINPADPQNTAHPAQYAQRMATLVQGVGHDLAHPIDTAESMADNARSEIAHDPGRFLGALLPNLAMGMVTDGAGEVAGEAAETAATGAEDTVGLSMVDTRPLDGINPSGDPAAHSVTRSTPWGSWVPDLSSADAAAAAGVKQAGAGLAQVERDLAGVHVSTERTDTVTPARDTQPAVDPPMAGPTRLPVSSTSTTTPWGTFGRVAATGTTEASATAGIDAAGSGLGQVERELATIQVHAEPDQSFSGRLVPGYLRPDYRLGDLNRQAYQAKWPNTAEDNALLNEVRRVWPEAGGLFDQELLALDRFASPEGALINNALWSGDDAALAEMDTEIRALVSALNKLPDHRGPVTHSVQVEPRDWGMYLHEYEPGATVWEPGFLAASKQTPYRGNIRFHIQSRHGKDISPMVPGRNPVVFPAGERFTVIAREFDERTSTWNIYLDDLGR